MNTVFVDNFSHLSTKNLVISGRFSAWGREIFRMVINRLGRFSAWGREIFRIG